MIEPVYLGDGVYIQPNPYVAGSLVLTTAGYLENGQEENRIFLDKAIIEALVMYIERWKTG